MAALLRLLITAQRTGEAAAEVPLGCLVRLQQAFGSTHATPDPRQGPAAATPALVEPLTGRELEVLGMLAAGRSNQAIASELVVTLNTVKSTSATFWASSARPAAPKPSPGPGNSA